MWSFRGEDKGLLEIRVHGRGGQGNVAAAEMLAQAAFFAGKHVQAFPAFGAERTGAPVVAFVRISERPIRLRSQVYAPQIVIVQDQTLVNAGVESVIGGLVHGGLVLLNAPTAPPELVAALPSGASAVAIPATDIALDTIGRPTPNTTLLGAFAALTQALPLEAIEQAVRDRFRGQIGDENAEAASLGYFAAQQARVYRVHRTVPDAPSSKPPLPRPSVVLTPGLVAAHGSSAGPDGYHTGSWRIYRPIWDAAKCTDCDLCVVYCPESVVVRRGARDYVTDLEFCKGCALCAEECPSKAITMVREDEVRTVEAMAIRDGVRVSTEEGTR